MKKLCILSLIVLLCCSIAIAQEAKRVHFLAGAGIGLPTGDLSKGWNLGFHGNFNVAIETSPGLTIEPKVEYHIFGLDKQGYSGISGGGVHALIFGADVRYLFPSASTAKFFIVGGGGMASWGISDLKVDGVVEMTGDSETKPTFSFGAGAMFGSSPTLRYFIEMRYAMILTSGSDVTWVPITFGLKF